MKIIKTFFRYVFSIILAISIILFLIISLASSTILNKSYLLSKLEEADYYNETYEYIKSNFENYINQSGLEISVLDNIISKERVENDINLIIDNIYDGTLEEIDVQEIEEKLNANIEEELGSKLVYSQKDTIDTFVNTISNEYKSALSFYKYTDEINNVYMQASKYLSLSEKILIAVSVVSIILLILLSIKEISKIFSSIGISFTISGLSFLLINNFINKNIGIKNLLILNEVTSVTVKNIINEILNKINAYGCTMLVVRNISNSCI